jgi:hypothetical protein
VRRATAGSSRRSTPATAADEELTQVKALFKTVELLARYSKIPAPLPEWPSTGRRTRTAVQPRVHDVRRRLTNEVIARLVHD